MTIHSANGLIDLLDEPAALAAAEPSARTWVSTDRHTRAQARLFERAETHYRFQVDELLEAIRLPSSALVYRGRRLVGLTPPAVVADAGPPPGWALRSKLLVPDPATPDGKRAKRLFSAVQYRPDIAAFIDDLPDPTTSSVIVGKSAVLLMAGAESAAPPSTWWTEIPQNTWMLVRQYAEEDLAAHRLPHSAHQP